MPSFRRQRWVGGEPRKPRSFTVRCGQEPHTPGGTKRALQVGGMRRKPRSHIARSGQEPHTPGGTKRALRVGFFRDFALDRMRN